MKITRKQLRQMIHEANPGSKVSAAVEKRDKAVQDNLTNWTRSEFQKTYDWFESDVIPAIESNTWPIVADKNYYFDVGPDDMRGPGNVKYLPKGFDLWLADITNWWYIKKGTKIRSPSDPFKVSRMMWDGDTPYPSMGTGATTGGFTLLNTYEDLEQWGSALGVLMQSDPGEAIKAADGNDEEPDIQFGRAKKKTESVEITPEQLRQIINEEINLLEADANSDGKLSADELRDLADDLEGDSGPNFPPLSHPLISQYADGMRGPVVSDKKVGDAWGDPWFKEYVSYTYSARPNNIQAKQSITLYRLLNDKYFARIYGSYNNRVSHKDPGEFDDPIKAIQAALDSSVVKGTTPAKDLIKKVGEKIGGDPTGGAWYD